MNIIITIIALIPLVLSIIALVTSIKYVYTTIGLRNRDKYSEYRYILRDMDRAAMHTYEIEFLLLYQDLKAMERHKQRAMKRHEQRAMKRHKALSGSAEQKSSLFSNAVNRRKA